MPDYFLEAHGRWSMKTIVLGAARGLGLELVKELLKKGQMVAAGVANIAGSETLVELARQNSERLLVFEADVTDETKMLRGAQACVSFFGQADNLVNSAGVLLPQDRIEPLQNCDTAALRRTFDVNTFGTVIAVKCFYPVLKKDGHAKFIVVTSEGVGIGCTGNWVPCYALSKTAATKAIGIMNATVQDVAFYALHPGRMNTEMGRTTAQIEPAESARGIYNILADMVQVTRSRWYIDYTGKALEF